MVTDQMDPTSRNMHDATPFPQFRFVTRPPTVPVCHLHERLATVADPRWQNSVHRPATLSRVHKVSKKS
jgi:hypothetical protein